jgi:hypothetical protein
MALKDAGDGYVFMRAEYWGRPCFHALHSKIDNAADQAGLIDFVESRETPFRNIGTFYLPPAKRFLVRFDFGFFWMSRFSGNTSPLHYSAASADSLAIITSKFGLGKRSRIVLPILECWEGPVQ